MTEEGFQKLITILEGAFQKDYSNKSKDTWWILLKDQPDEKIIERAIQFCRSDRARYGPPSLGELVDAGEDGAVLAWSRVRQAIIRYGPSKSVQFEGDPAIHSTVMALGGWPVVANTPDEELRWMQSNFERVYRVMLRNPRPEIPKYLPGFDEGYNRSAVGLGYLARVDVQRIPAAGQPRLIEGKKD